MEFVRIQCISYRTSEVGLNIYFTMTNEMHIAVLHNTQ
jgi:hypothetical protein